MSSPVKGSPMIGSPTRGRHLQRSAKKDSTIGRSISQIRELQPAEIPKSPEDLVPINFGVKYDPAQIGLQYHIKDHPSPQYVYEIPLEYYVENPTDTKSIVVSLFSEHSQVLSPKVIGHDQVGRLVDRILDKCKLLRPQKQPSEPKFEEKSSHLFDTSIEVSNDDFDRDSTSSLKERSKRNSLEENSVTGVNEHN